MLSSILLKFKFAHIPGRSSSALFCTLLSLVVGAVFLPSLGNGFVNYDDPGYVTSNPEVKKGLTWEGIRWALTTNYASNWHPLTWLSHMLDCQLFGLRSWGHHLTSIVLHALNVVLLFLILKEMTGARWRSLLVALLFGLHPLRVQSVTWIAERKDVLSTFFWLLTLLAYTRYVREATIQSPNSKASDDAARNTEHVRRSLGHVSRFRCFRFATSRYYLLALVFFALSLLSKPMTVTLPLVLLLLDYWPLERFPRPSPQSAAMPQTWLSRARVHLASLRHLVLEKVLFFALAIPVAAVTFMVQKHTGAVQTLKLFSFVGRIENALISYCRYLGKFVCPLKLSAFYPHPGTWPLGEVLLAACVLLGISIVVVTVARGQPYLAVGWFWYIGTLVPVIGLVQVGGQSIADRYTYVPMIGIAVAVIWALSDLSSHRRYSPITFGALGTAALLACVVLTRQEIGYWANSEKLFRRVLAVTKDNALAHFNLGVALSAKNPDEALSELEAALRLSPGAADLHSKTGMVLMEMGYPDLAAIQFQASLTLEPGDADAELFLAEALQGAGRIDESITHYREALKLKPDLVDAHTNLGQVLSRQRQFDQAIGEFRQALRLRPDSAETHDRLGIALGEVGQFDEAAVEFQKALSLKPGWPEAHNRLGIVFRRQRRFDEAIVQFRQALKLNPNYADAHVNLGVAFYNQGSIDEAISQFQEALKLQPDHALARKNLDALIERKRESPQP